MALQAQGKDSSSNLVFLERKFEKEIVNGEAFRELKNLHAELSNDPQTSDFSQKHIDSIVNTCTQNGDDMMKSLIKEAQEGQQDALRLSGKFGNVATNLQGHLTESERNKEIKKLSQLKAQKFLGAKLTFIDSLLTWLKKHWKKIAALGTLGVFGGTSGAYAANCYALTTAANAAPTAIALLTDVAANATISTAVSSTGIGTASVTATAIVEGVPTTSAVICTGSAVTTGLCVVGGVVIASAAGYLIYKAFQHLTKK